MTDSPSEQAMAKDVELAAEAELPVPTCRGSLPSSDEPDLAVARLNEMPGGQPSAPDIVSSQLMNGEMATMTAALGNYMGQSKHLDKLMLGIAGAVSVTVPIIMLILIFQRQIVAGMTAGSVKG